MLSLRSVTDDDYEYLYALNERTMRGYAEQTYGAWNEETARRIFAERWRPETIKIEQIDGQDGGMLEVMPIETGIWLDNPRATLRQEAFEVRVSGDEIQVKVPEQ